MPKLHKISGIYAPVCGRLKPTPLKINYSSTNITKGTNYSTISPTVTGGDNSIKQYSFSGTLPSEISFNTNSGVFTGPSYNQWPFSPIKTTGTGNISTVYVSDTSDGGKIVAGKFTTNNITFGSTTLTKTGTNNIFVAKLSNTGTWEWAKTNTGAGSVDTCSVSITSNNEIIIFGGFSSSSITVGSTTLNLTGTNNIFVAKLSNTGNWQWATTNTGAGYALGSNSTTNGIVATSDGGALISGTFSGNNITFGSTTLVFASGYASVFVAKISNNGNWTWATATSSSSTANATNGTISIDKTSDNSAIISGTFYGGGSLIFGSTTLTQTITRHVFVAKISNAGVWQWAIKNSGGGAGLTLNSTKICVTSNDEAIVSGTFSGNNIIFGSTTLTKTGTNNMFFIKVTSSGSISWAIANAGLGMFTNDGSGIDATSDNGVIVTGAFFYDITLGTTTLVSSRNNNSYADVFVAKLSNAGVWQWAIKNSGTSTGSTTACSVNVTSDDVATVAGIFSYNTTIGSTTLTGEGGSSTIFVAKVSSNGQWKQGGAFSGLPTNLTVTVQDINGQASTPITISEI